MSEENARKNRGRKEDKPPKCKRCGSKEVVPILWGFPTPETFDMYGRYKEEHCKPPIWLGGYLARGTTPGDTASPAGTHTSMT